MNELEKDNFLYVIGQYVKKQRIAKGWTQDEVADILNMSTNGIQLLEKGELNIALTRLVQLIELLDVPYTFIQEQFHLYGYESFQSRRKEVTIRKENKRK